MSTKILKDLFVDELQDMYDAEHRIVLALPKMIHAASCDQLKAALEHHLGETEGHVTKLEQAFTSIGKTPKAKKCEATVGLLKEGDEIISDFKGSPAINAALISAGQKVEHYEIASYGCLHEWAGMLGFTDAAGLLEEILGQEKAANEKLTELARDGKNKEACGEAPRKPEVAGKPAETSDEDADDAKSQSKPESKSKSPQKTLAKSGQKNGQKKAESKPAATSGKKSHGKNRKK